MPRRLSSIRRRPSRILLGLVATLLWPLHASAQQAADGNPPSDRTVPGFTLFDSALMSIEHVDPSHKNSITVFSTLRKKDLVPRDISLEILPLLPSTGQRAQTVEQQFERLKNAGPASFLAFSVAISQDVTPPGATDSLSQIAFGGRTFLIAGRLNSTLDSLMTQYCRTTKALEAAERAAGGAEAAGEPARQKTYCDTVTQTTSADRDTADAGAQETDPQLRATRLLLQSREWLRRLTSAPKNRVGFLLEVAAAEALRVPDNRLSESDVARWGAWVTPIYRFDGRPLEVSGSFRAMSEPDTSSSVIDFGGRIGVRANDAYYSLEGLGRHRFTDTPEPDDDLWYGRLVGALTYPLSRNTHVSFAFGKNFKSDFSNGGSLLASLGITIGRGQMTLGAGAGGN